MRVLVVGDVVSTQGCAFLEQHLRSFKRFKDVDLCIVNGENSAPGNGITPQSAETIFQSGADVITTGNHVWHRREIYPYLDEQAMILRPYNYPAACPGRGTALIEVKRRMVMVANLIGTAFMENVDNPFLAADRILRETEGEAGIRIFDFHAETTSEKLAMAHYLDGRASLLFGTHTHVQTADEYIFPKGLGYMTDVGMTGPVPSILGLEPAAVIAKFVTGMPQKFETSKNPVRLCGLLADIDDATGKTVLIERVAF